jgi:HPt (histidine-containing phosphotransfer) domain-containing protein
LDRLIEAGFEEVLIKPLSVAALQGTVRRFASMQVCAFARGHAHAGAPHAAQPAPQQAQPSGRKYPLWDEDAALRAMNGNPAHVDAMRRLFRAELPEQSRRIRAAISENATDGLRTELHKLIASAGFVGAARLAEHARSLQTHLSHAASEHAGMQDEGVRRACAQLEGTLADTLDSV